MPTADEQRTPPDDRKNQRRRLRHYSCRKLPNRLRYLSETGLLD